MIDPQSDPNADSGSDPIPDPSPGPGSDLDSEPEPETPSEGTVFDVLSSPRRRYALYYLRTVGGSAELNEIARQVAAWENGIERRAVGRQQRKRVYVSLYQTHVPRLAEAGVIDYDAERGIVTLAEHAGTVDAFLTGRRQSTQPWTRYYLAVAAAGVFGVVAAVAGVLDVSGLVLAVAIAGAVAALATAQFVAERRRHAEAPPDVESGEERV